MTLKEVKDQIDRIYERVGNVDCFFRDENCASYRKLTCHIGCDSRENEIAILDLNKI